MSEEYKKDIRTLVGESAALMKKYMTPYQLECLKHPLSPEEMMAQTQRNHKAAVLASRSKENLAKGVFGDEDMVTLYDLKDCKVTEIVRYPNGSSVGNDHWFFAECVATPVSDSNQDIPDLYGSTVKVYYIRWTTTLYTLQDGDICSVIVGMLYHSKSKGYYIIARYGKCEASDKQRRQRTLK